MKILKNKRMLTGLIASLIGLSVLMTGLSLAWFTNSGAQPNSGVDLSTLGVTVGLQKESFGIMYPGQNYIDNIASIRNYGNIQTLVQLDLIADVLIRSDADGNPLPESQYYTIRAPKELFTIVEQEKGASRLIGFDGGKPVYETLAHPLGDWFKPDFSSWYHWGVLDGKLYVAMDGNDELRFAYTIDTNGKEMGNLYQNAVVSVKVEWLATQYIPDAAIKDVLGIDFNDVKWFEEVRVLDGVGPFSLVRYADALAERIAGLPDCSYRRFLENKLANIE